MFLLINGNMIVKNIHNFLRRPSDKYSEVVCIFSFLISEVTGLSNYYCEHKYLLETNHNIISHNNQSNLKLKDDNIF